MITLVTGANGHIGSHLVHALSQRGRKMRAFVRRSSDLSGLLDAQGVLPKGVELAYGDVTDAKSLLDALDGVGSVFHTAAVFNTRLNDESEMQRANVEGTRMLLAALKQKPVIRLVYTSSVAAIGYTRDPRVVLDEATWNTDPIDVYTATKAESERLVHAAVAEGLDAVIVNPATVLGPGDHKPTPSNAFILLAMQKGAPVTFDSGHTYVDVDDVAEGHLLAEEKGKKGERYVLANEQVSNDVLLTQLARRTGKLTPKLKLGHASVELLGWGVELKAKLLGGKPLFTRAKAHKLIDYYGYFSHAKAAHELGWQPRPLAETLDRTEAWFRQKGWL